MTRRAGAPHRRSRSSLHGAEEHAERRRVEQRRLREVDHDRRGTVVDRRAQPIPQLRRTVEIHVAVDDEERDARFRPLFVDPKRALVRRAPWGCSSIVFASFPCGTLVQTTGVATRREPATMLGGRCPRTSWSWTRPAREVDGVVVGRARPDERARARGAPARRGTGGKHPRGRPESCRVHRQRRAPRSLQARESTSGPDRSFSSSIPTRPSRARWRSSACGTPSA